MNLLPFHMYAETVANRRSWAWVDWEREQSRENRARLVTMLELVLPCGRPTEQRLQLIHPLGRTPHFGIPERRVARYLVPRVQKELVDFIKAFHQFGMPCLQPPCIVPAEKSLGNTLQAK
jgi:hypothetical protein